MTSKKVQSIRPLPAIFYEDEILVPLKCDVTLLGARFVDTFVWKLYGSSLSPDEFASRTCADLNLPIGFNHRISSQISEQVNSYRELVTTLHKLALNDPPWIDRLVELQYVLIGIRLNTLDYSDKLYWDATNSYITPEIFARTTCADLGLPSEMEPAISHKLRESLFRLIVQWIEEPNTSTLPAQYTKPLSEIKVTLVSSYHAVDMVNNLWKRAKPNSVEDIALVPQPLLPKDRETNASIWELST